VPLAFYSDPLILSAISSSTPSSPPNPLARKVAPAAAAIGVGSRRSRSRQQFSPGPPRTQEKPDGGRVRRVPERLERTRADSVANKEVYRRVDA
jgi:hypothetical protein